MNLFRLPDTLPDEEFFEALIPDKGVLIERIVSIGQSSPEGFWYDRDRDEWVVLLQGHAKGASYSGWEGRCGSLHRRQHLAVRNG